MNLLTGTLSWLRKFFSDNEEEKAITRSVLLHTLDKIRLLHPIMPFVTEEIFDKSQKVLSFTAEYPTVNPAFEDLGLPGVESLKFDPCCS